MPVATVPFYAGGALRPAMEQTPPVGRRPMSEMQQSTTATRTRRSRDTAAAVAAANAVAMVQPPLPGWQVRGGVWGSGAWTHGGPDPVIAGIDSIEWALLDARRLPVDRAFQLSCVRETFLKTYWGADYIPPGEGRERFRAPSRSASHGGCHRETRSSSETGARRRG